MLLQDTKPASRIFLSLTFVSGYELGWDPTILPISISAFGGIRGCDTNADEFDHRGVGVLSNYSADTMAKRGARMWKVKDLLGTDYVLQNVWDGTDRNSEHGLWEEDLMHIPEERDLLIPLGYWLARVDGQVDHTAIITMCGQKQSFQKFRALIFKKLPAIEKITPGYPFGAVDRAARGNKAVRSKSSSRRPGYRKVSHERQHYRIDSVEAATPLSSSLLGIFGVLANIAEGMPWLWYLLAVLNFGQS